MEFLTLREFLKKSENILESVADELDEVIIVQLAKNKSIVLISEKKYKFLAHVEQILRSLRNGQLL